MFMRLVAVSLNTYASGSASVSAVSNVNACIPCTGGAGVLLVTIT